MRRGPLWRKNKERAVGKKNWVWMRNKVRAATLLWNTIPAPPPPNLLFTFEPLLPFKSSFQESESQKKNLRLLQWYLRVQIYYTNGSQTMQIHFCLFVCSWISWLRLAPGQLLLPQPSLWEPLFQPTQIMSEHFHQRHVMFNVKLFPVSTL